MLLYANDTTAIKNSRFEGNKAEYGGGLAYHAPGHKLKIHNCLFVDNHANKKGGAVASVYPPRFASEDRVDIVDIRNCTFVGNAAGRRKHDWKDMVLN